ncbi:uncharacterized protein LOC113675008, partial [Pocillopora damicornis]|uniref:uncharacterized protein LOC113675008 n=1 Tax=Pocillopora damicornis TaxID=46731 RepID=UPI000F54E367
MEVFQKNVYLLSKEESKTLTLSEIAELRKGKQYQSRVKFFQDMKDDDVRNLLENKFSPILSNKRFSCATRDGQTSARLNFHGEHRVWDGRTIKRKVQGGSALYLVLEDEPVFNSVSPARGTPSSLQGHLPSTSFYHNSKNGQTVSWTQTPQSATTVTSLKTTNSTENAVETTQWERDMNTNNPGWLGDNLNAPNSPGNSAFHMSCHNSSAWCDVDISIENLTAAGAVETLSEASLLTNGNQEQNELMEKDCLISDKSDSSGQSDSGISSEASACPAQALNRPISPRRQNARMKPAEGPLQGGGLFRAVVDEELPRSMETGWAKFGDKPVKVWVSRDGLCLFGEEIPRGDAPGPVTVTFATLNGECMAKTTSTYKKCENPMTWQITHFKRALNGVEECVKRLRNVADSCYESNKFAEENHHDSGVTQVVKAQLGEEGYFGDTEKSDTESEDSYRMDNNENEIEE